jgi:putative acetyltransferase
LIVRISVGTTSWYGQGPVSVLRDNQTQCIGKSSIIEGMSLIKEIGAQNCDLVGGSNFYKKFRFKNYPELIHEGIREEVFLVLTFTERVLKKIVVVYERFRTNG